jgi:cytochrome c2
MNPRYARYAKIIVAAVLILLAMLLGSCAQGFNYGRGASMTGGDPQAGKQKIVLHDCHSCHEIPGIPLNAQRRGPSLKHWARQSTTPRSGPIFPESLEDFLQHPDRALHGSGVKSEMTMSSVKAGDAKDIAAYLFSID